jgi:hypothetical protein
MKRYILLLPLLATFVVAATYSLRARWIRDRLLDRSARAYGRDSPEFRRQEAFIGSEWYVAGLRFASGVVAMGMLVLLYYAVRDLLKV